MNYEKMSVNELRALAKEAGAKGITSLKKQELIELLGSMNTDTNQADEAVETVLVAAPEVTAAEDSSAAIPNNTTDSERSRRELRAPQGEGEYRRREMRAPQGEGEYRRREMRAPQGEGEYRRREMRAPQGEGEYGRREMRAPQGEGEYGRREMRAPQGEGEYGRREMRAPQGEGEYRRREMRAPQGEAEYSRREMRAPQGAELPPEFEQLDSGETKEGILEVMPDGYGFIRCDNFLPGENDVYVSPAQIRKLNLKTGDIVVGNTKIRGQGEKFGALLYVKSVNGMHPSEAVKRPRFEDLTPVFPNERLLLETPGCGPATRIVDIISPIGKGQRGMIVSQPKAGKTTLLKQIAKAITRNYPDIYLLILLVDERPEEVTDMKESIAGDRVEVIYSTFDELPENHKRVSEMVIERAKRLVEHKNDVVILLDSITRLARAYNLTVTASGRTLSGGLDPAALHMPKKFFGAARNMREGGSLTVLATALVETGSRMDDVVFEEFKGTGNMELVLDRNLSEKRIFPAINLPKSSTRRDDLLLTPSELEANYIIRRAFNSMKSDEAVERIINLFVKTKTNREFVEVVKKTKLI